MNDDHKKERIGQLIAAVVNAAIQSGLTTDDSIACFGVASNVLAAHKASSGPQPDPHVSFAKGLAQLAEVRAPSNQLH